MSSHLFFIEIHSTCFWRVLHPSSGVQLNCSYSHMYISVSVWYGSKPLPGVQGRESIAQCHKKLMNVCCRIAMFAIYEDFN
jgi:hypothetical protein